MLSALAATKLLRRFCTGVTGLVFNRSPAPLAYSTQAAAGGEPLEQIRSRIFGTHIGNGLRSGRKLLRKKLVGEQIAAYYPEPIYKKDPLFVNLDVERHVANFCIFLIPANSLLPGSCVADCFALLQAQD